MRAFALLSVLTAAATAWAQSGTIDAYLATESSIARSGVFANIGPSGSKSSGAVRIRKLDCILTPPHSPETCDCFFSESRCGHR